MTSNPCAGCGAPTKSVTKFCTRTNDCRNAQARYWSKARRTELRVKERAWHESHREQLRQDARVRRAYWTARLNQIKVESGCVLCGFQNARPGYFDLDHVDPTTKTAEIAKRICGLAPGKPENEAWFEQEVAKCQVLCVACHREKSVAEMMLMEK